MRSNILGFRQDLLIKYNLDMTDALLLDYIRWACVSNKMKKICDEDNQPYVWLQHKHILEDLPILHIKEDMLKKRLSALIEKGMLTKIIKRDEIRGSRAYYTVTALSETLTMTDETYQSDSITPDNADQGDSITPDSTRPSVIDYPSDNKLNSIDNKLDIDTISSINTTMSLRSGNIDKFVNDYNTICKSLPRCTKVTDKRRKSISKILKKYTQEEILQVFNNLESSDFCKGNNNRGWKADIDFILREDKFVSVLEGKYGGEVKAFTGSRDKFSEFGVVKSVPVDKETILNEAF